MHALHYTRGYHFPSHGNLPHILLTERRFSARETFRDFFMESGLLGHFSCVSHFCNFLSLKALACFFTFSASESIKKAWNDGELKSQNRGIH